METLKGPAGIFFFFIDYLAALGLSCCMHDLQSLVEAHRLSCLQHVGS